MPPALIRKCESRPSLPRCQEIPSPAIASGSLGCSVRSLASGTVACTPLGCDCASEPASCPDGDASRWSHRNAGPAARASVGVGCQRSGDDANRPDPGWQAVDFLSSINWYFAHTCASEISESASPMYIGWGTRKAGIRTRARQDFSSMKSHTKSQRNQRNAKPNSGHWCHAILGN